MALPESIWVNPGSASADKAWHPDWSSIMDDTSNQQVRDLTLEEAELVTGGFLGSLIRKVGRAAGPVVRSSAGLADAPAEGGGFDFSDA
jgi:hypothetical protein